MTFFVQKIELIDSGINVIGAKSIELYETHFEIFLSIYNTFAKMIVLGKRVDNQSAKFTIPNQPVRGKHICIAHRLVNASGGGYSHKGLDIFY